MTYVQYNVILSLVTLAKGLSSSLPQSFRITILVIDWLQLALHHAWPHAPLHKTHYVFLKTAFLSHTIFLV